MRLKLLLRNSSQISNELVNMPHFNTMCYSILFCFARIKLVLQMNKEYKNIYHTFFSYTDVTHARFGPSKLYLYQTKRPRLQLKRRGGSRGGGGGPWGQDPPPPFGGPPNFIKKEKMLRACARKHRVLVLNSYPDHPPPPFPKSCIRP